ncbi:MAG: sortase [Caldilineae bacterium]|nr:sortase [Caldilineae bacterium]
MQRFLARLAAAFAARYGTLLLVFGALLLGLGGLMQLARMRQMSALEALDPPPDFEASLRVEAGPGESPVLAAGAESPGPLDPALGPTPDPLRDPAAQPIASPTPAPKPERIEIPAVGIDTPVVEVGWEARVVNGEQQGNVWQTADYAAGLHRGSAGIGEPGNTVISGHNNIAGSVFAELHAVEEGDLVYLSSGERRLPYRVETKLVLWEEGASPERRRVNARWIEATPDERLTLISCYPPWGNTHRVIVVARPLDDEALPDLAAGAAAR